jgi:hypothetical protein
MVVVENDIQIVERNEYFADGAIRGWFGCAIWGFAESERRKR